MDGPAILGIHHVTAIGGDPGANRVFYERLLGLRLVKRTVNFDDPTTHHLYYGDHAGAPGTILTFFPHPMARPGRAGSGEVGRTVFAAPRGTLDWWRQRLKSAGVDAAEIEAADDHRLDFADHDGTRLAIVEADAVLGGQPHAARSGIDAVHALFGFEGVSLRVREPEATAAFLVEQMGFREAGGDDARRWLEVAAGGPAQRVEIVRSDAPPAQLGAGSVHHVAFRVADDAGQLSLRERLEAAGVHPTPVQDRQYFRSIYFREPGGVIFEVATDPPGFATDEPQAELGRTLKLPPWLEGQRAAIERALPPLPDPGDSLQQSASAEA